MIRPDAPPEPRRCRAQAAGHQRAVTQLIHNRTQAGILAAQRQSPKALAMLPGEMVKPQKYEQAGKLRSPKILARRLQPAASERDERAQISSVWARCVLFQRSELSAQPARYGIWSQARPRASYHLVRQPWAHLTPSGSPFAQIAAVSSRASNPPVRRTQGLMGPGSVNGTPPPLASTATTAGRAPGCNPLRGQSPPRL